MRLVFLLVFLIGGYFFMGWRLSAPFDLSPLQQLPIWLAQAAAMGVMIIYPMSWWRTGWIRTVASLPGVRRISYFNMAFLSVLFAMVLLRDLVMIISSLFIDLTAYRPLFGWATFGAAIVLTAWGHVQVRMGPSLKRVRVVIPKLPAVFSGFRIVQLSDVHIGEDVKRPQIERVVQRVNALDADMVAITGDLIDGPVARLAVHVQPLSKLTSRHGTYFVAGNHEHYAGFEAWIETFQGFGFQVLMNEHRVITRDASKLVVAGVDDHSISRDPDADVRSAGKNSSADDVRILLAHQPRSAFAAAREPFDLQLSGHTHGGQFLPWNLVTKWMHKFTAGLYRVEGMWLYVSRGTFYWGPPVRVFAPAEITVLELHAS